MIFATPKGIIALDIDGTITDQTHTIQPEVVNYFLKLQAEQWQFIFITGRPYQWGYEVLQHFPFTYAFAIQNGALILEMPKKIILSRKYLSTSLLSKIEGICREEQTDFVIYAGWEYEDVCYYRSQFFPSQILSYIERRYQALRENWIKLTDFQSLFISEFLSLKCFFNDLGEAVRFSQRIESELGLHAPVNRDPFDPSYYVVQVTHHEANKGNALHAFMQAYSLKCPVIAAGDDFNDLSMLKCADVRVVMQNAPEELKEIAHVIAPLASENGIITGLKQALHLIHQKR